MSSNTEGRPWSLLSGQQTSPEEEDNGGDPWYSSRHIPRKKETPIERNCYGKRSCWSRLWVGHPHLLSALVSTFFVLLFAALFAVTLYTRTPGDDGLTWGAGVILVAIWMGVLIALVPHRAILWANFVLMGSIFIVYIRQADHLYGIVIYSLRIIPYIPVTTTILYLFSPWRTLRDRTYFLLTDSTTTIPTTTNDLTSSNHSTTTELLEEDPYRQIMPIYASSSSGQPQHNYHQTINTADLVDYGDHLISHSDSAFDQSTVLQTSVSSVPRWRRPFRRFNAYLLKHPHLHTFLRNYICYFIPLLLGLNWGFAPRYLPNINLSPSSVSSWGAPEWIAVLVGVSFGLCVAVYHLYLIIKHRKQTVPLIKWYLLGYGLSLVTLVSISFLAHSQGLEFHLHHWMLAIIFYPFLRFDDPISGILQGFLLGIHMDGMINWGMAPLWVSPTPPMMDFHSD